MEQIIDMRIRLRYLGVLIIGLSQIFGDNESVINSSTKFQAKLCKQYIELSFHRVRESIAENIYCLHHLRSEDNPADIISKH